MKSLSKKVVFITVLLQLKVSIQLVNADKKLEFGDMLVFPQTECGIEGASSHYAIYVDHENIRGRKTDDELFHMIIRSNGWSGCTFTPLRKEVTYTVDNYPESEIPRQSKEKMIEAIENLNNNCGTWSWSNTCEHIATSIRFGEAYKQCNQKGTLAGSIICPFFKLFAKSDQLPNASRSGRAAAKAA